MTTEDRLRDAIRARADSIEPSAEGWQRIEAKLGTARHGRRGRYVVVPAAAACVAAALVGASLIADDDAPQPIANDPSPSATSTTGPAPTTTVVPTRSAYLWPSDPSRGYATPELLANAFAVDFLGMSDPVIKPFRQNEPSAGEIDIHPNPRASIRTVLSVQRTSAGWVVSAANSPSIELDTPEHVAVVSSPIELAGRSRSFEGNILVTLLEDGSTLAAGRTIGDGFFTGHGTEMGPFTASLRFGPPSTDEGVLVLYTRSMEDGSVVEATVRRVRFRS